MNIFSFIKKSFEELEHVVWPTKAETKKYFYIVVSSIIVAGLFLTIVGSFFSTALFGVRDVINPTTPEINELNEDISTSDFTVDSIPVTSEEVDIDKEFSEENN